MASCEKSPVSCGGKGGKGDVVVGYAHETKKLRLRAISAEKETYFKFISKPLAHKVSYGQLFIAGFISAAQIITMSLVTGRYSSDSMSEIGGGLWTSFFTGSAAVLTLWSLKNVKYWKLHLSFALHIISMMAALVILIIEFGGNLRHLKYRVWESTHPDPDYPSYVTGYNRTSSSYYYRGGYFHDERQETSVNALITSLLLNTVMATGTLVQLVTSLLMTVMTGRAICCGQSKAHGKLFELEIAGSDTADAVAVLKHQIQTGNLHQGIGNANVVGIPVPVTAAAVAPPPYAESVAETV